MSDGRKPADKTAVAIRYDKDREQAPRIIAKGKGFLAQQIIDAAKAYGVPVYQNQSVASLLMAVELDQEIPPDLYQAVANVLAYVYKLDSSVIGRSRERPRK